MAAPANKQSGTRLPSCLLRSVLKAFIQFFIDGLKSKMEAIVEVAPGV
jgi:hypothetical protein